jgi:hypothetical protein
VSLLASIFWDSRSFQYGRPAHVQLPCPLHKSACDHSTEISFDPITTALPLSSTWPPDLHTASRNNSNETCANHEYRQLRLPCSPLSPHPHHHLHLWTPSAALPDDLANRPPGSDPFVSPDRRQHLRKPDDRPCSLSRRQYTHGNGSGQRRCHPTLTAVVGEWTMGRCIHGYRCAKPRRHGIECLGDALGQASVSFTYPEPISDIPTLTRYPQTARKVRSRQSTTDCQQRGARWRVPTDQ